MTPAHSLEALPPRSRPWSRSLLRMSSTQIFQVIYALIAIFGASLTVIRLQAGDWLSALWPALIAGFCVYRLFTVTEE